MVRVPGYSINEELYNGSRTLVYRGIRESDEKPVVIKLLKNFYPSFSELVQFRNQYTIAKNLNYPEIIQTYSLENYQNGYALVMEDMGGISLSKYFTNNVETRYIASLQEFIKIAISLCDILDTLYRQRIIHKDIKPANILINPETKQVKLIDFSIASLLPKETQTVLNTNVLEGTLSYISPEQTGRMNRGIDYRTDFYSLGVTFYELLTGELPFKSDDAMELVHCHIAKVPPSINKPHPNPLLGKERGQEIILDVEKKGIRQINKPHPNPLLGKERGQEIILDVEKKGIRQINKPHPNPLLGKERGQEIPWVLSDIVMKLMAKNAEDRYQSALGLKYDLEICLKQLQETGSIEYFEIAQRDFCDRFIIPEKLYGRESEVEELLAAFERVAKGNSELMLVAGFSGIGKTAIVNEVHKPIVKQRGYFIKGKFDQFNRNIPFSAFVQAFRDLMGQLRTESDVQLSSWKSKILQALGDNGQVIIDVIPELEQIIGKQLPVTELSGTAAQNRFNLLFQKFIQVFTSKEHPLVVFLDDLQWADSASLNLMQLLMSESKSGYLLLIGAYRDNEVFPAHPLMFTLEEISSLQGIINTITLSPLSEESLNQLVADTLNCPCLTAKPLTQIVYQKTQGNPFFSTQFLKVLYEDSLIKFDFDANSWGCDISEVKKLALTDDVVEFMALQLQKLPESTQNNLKLAACIGNQFDLTTLAIVCQKSKAETAKDLWKALQQGLIIPQSEIYKFYFEEEMQVNGLQKEHILYKFLHDRVQQAAYCLIPENQKQTTHYHIGKLLLEQIPPEAKEDRIFELVNQLNYGITLINEQKERDELARLNLIACRRARSAIAYQAGSEYTSIGLSLLGENAWLEQYEMCLAFHDLGAELAFLSGDLNTMEKLVEAVITKANYLLEQVSVYRIIIQANVSQNKLTEALSIAQQLLQKLGVSFPETPTPNDIEQSIVEISELIGDRKIEELVNLPLMTDREKIAIVQVANSVIPSAQMSGSPLFPLLIALSVKLSIQYGNISDSAFSYACFGILACRLLQDVEKGVKFGELAVELVSKLDAKAVKPQVFDAVGLFILHRKSHIKKILPLAQEGYATALEVGNHEFAGIAEQYSLYSFWCSQPLANLEQETKAYCNALLQLNQLITANWCRIYWQSISNLLGFASHPSILSGEVISETEFLPLLLEARDLLGVFFFYLHKLMLCYLFGEIELAKSHSIEVRRYLIAGGSTIGEPMFYFYDSLSILAALSLESPQLEELQQVEQNQAQLQQQWANFVPTNHQHKLDLVEAEKHRVLGQKIEAIELYDKAISGAKENEYLHEEALANELTAKFYLDWNKEKVASSYMQEAYYCYARWGAKAKTDDLEKRYPQLLGPILQTQEYCFQASETYFQTNQTIQTSRSSSSISEALDFASILKATQALSSEIKLEELISILLQIVIENAGADKAALVLLQDDIFSLEAIATDGIVTYLSIPYENSSDLPKLVLNYVKRSLETVVLGNATINNDFITDQYLIQQQPKSLLCLPILDRGKLTGLLYLENKLTFGAFTPARLEVINLLCSQAAISLGNARLYETSENALKELKQAQLQMVQNEKMATLGNLVAGVAHEVNNPIGFLKGSISNAQEYIQDLFTHIECYQDNYPTPKEEVIENAEEIDLEFVTEDLPKLLDSMKVATERIKDISISLRTFSRADTSEKVACNIHEGIDSTILILKYRIKANDKRPAIQVIKEYCKLPLVKCFLGQLNQVFMNIIANAIDALDMISEGKTFAQIEENPHKIMVITELSTENNSVIIKIKDNGPGIPFEVKERIFDNLFTTKGVGKGTGLGLAIAKQIVEETHGGKISCNSTVGEGTEFVIELPIKS